MSKRLIVLCDGTWKSEDQPAVTNVCKLHKAIDDSETAAVRQLSCYVEGVGNAIGERVRGGAFGVGLSERVQEGYAFLVDHYEPGDELFLFGFSRGAYTARSLAGLIRNSSILRREHRHMLGAAYDLYRSRKPRHEPRADDAADFRERWSHPQPTITFIGVWDTVGSLGIPMYRLRLPFLSRRWSFHNTTLSSYVQNAFHAMAIDERRRPFLPTLWVEDVDEQGRIRPRPAGQHVEQVWFAGVHSDVGGGYDDPALSEIPLLWMAARAQACGLVLRPDHLVLTDPNVITNDQRRYGQRVAPDARAELNESLSPFYRAMRPVDRRLQATDGRPINASLASSVRLRLDHDTTYTPPGLSDWLAGHRPVTELPPEICPRPEDTPQPARPQRARTRGAMATDGARRRLRRLLGKRRTRA